MKSGIEKDQLLRMLNGMVDNLEEAESTLHDSLADIRIELLLTQSSRLTKFENVLVSLETKGAREKYNSSTVIQDYNEATALKLELGF